MKTNILDTVIDGLIAIPRSEWDCIAKKSGVRLGTLRKIAYRETADPGFLKVLRLYTCLKNRIKP